jgi:hypothetical protein
MRIVVAAAAAEHAIEPAMPMVVCFVVALIVALVEVLVAVARVAEEPAALLFVALLLAEPLITLCVGRQSAAHLVQAVITLRRRAAEVIWVRWIELSQVKLASALPLTS